MIVLQAAGARASGRPAEPTLEKIENTGRQALTETRRLLDVTIGCAGEAITIEITDDGTRPPATRPRPPLSGHGLAGMRERVAMFGGDLSAGPRPTGGFTVRVRLPLTSGLPDTVM